VREADRSHSARRKATRPVAPGISPRKSKGGLGKQRCHGGGGVRCSVIANTVTFTGRRLDDETGLFYYRNRYYHAQLGRFVSRDPISYEAGDFNVYRYCGNNPLTRTDPKGLVPWIWIHIGVEAFIYATWYGNYCGPGSPAGPPIGPPPVDALDACCLAHDRCYGRAGVTWTAALPRCGTLASRACDAALDACARGVNCAALPWWRRPHCYTYRTEVIAYF